MSFNSAVWKRRPSLLAGSSLAALCLMALAGVALTPTSARAANECGDPAANPGADAFSCSGEQTSVTYIADGDLTLSLDDDLSITEGGLSVTASGAEAVNIFAGATIEGTDLSIVSTSGAALSLLHTGTVDTVISLWDSDTGDGPMVISGVSRGVSLTNTGGGAMYFYFFGESLSASAGNGVEMTGQSRLDLQTAGVVTASEVGIKTTTSGLITMIVNDIVAPIGIHAATTGPEGVIMSVNGDIAGSDTGILLESDAAEITIIEGASVTGGAGGALRVTGDAGPITISNAGSLTGQLLIDSDGPTSFSNTGVWRTTGENRLSAGQATLSGGGLIVTNTGATATSIEFGTDGVFSPTGMLAVGDGAEGAATLLLEGLGEWANGAEVLFGANGDLSGSDGVPNDRIVAHGADFEGLVSVQGRALGALFMDVSFSGQADCSAAVSADCLDLTGGATSGATAVVVNRVGGGVGGTAPIVLIDLGGGNGAQGDFELSPLSTGYRAPPPGEDASTATVDGGLFRYALRYLEDSGQHALVGFADTEVGELGLIGDAGLVAWDISTTSWLQRQADLRDNIGADAPDHTLGAWLRIASNKIDYTLLQHVAAFGTDYAYNTSYAQETKSLIGGVDLLGVMGEGRGWVVGVTAAKTTSDLDFRTSPTAVNLEGYSIGAYASLSGGLYYLDAIVNASTLDLEYDSAPLMDTGEVKSLGVQVEGGVRFVVAEGLAYAEPLVALSRVTTELPGLDFSDVSAAFDETTTSRGALGLRVGGRLPFETWTAAISGTGRVWQEFEGEDRVTLSSNGPDAVLVTDTGELLGDIGASVGVFTNDLRLSASFDVGHRFKQDYSSTDLAFSLRYWF